MCTFTNTEAHQNLGQTLPFDLLFVSVPLRPEVSALKAQETSGVNVGISNPTAPLALKVTLCDDHHVQSCPLHQLLYCFNTQLNQNCQPQASAGTSAGKVHRAASDFFVGTVFPV